AEHRDHVARGPLGILETHFHAINHSTGGLADGRTDGQWLRARNLRQLHGRAEVRAQLARDPFVTQQIGAVGRYVDHDLVIADPHRVDEARSRWGRRVELQDPRVVGAAAEVFRRAAHAARLHAG